MQPIFSHSRLSTFETCPRQYRYRYVDRLARPWVGVEAHAGAAVHAALEHLYTQRQRDGRVASPAELRDCFRAAWEKVPAARLRVVRRGFEIEDYVQLGLHCLESYYRRFHPFDQAETLEVEARVELTLGETPPLRLVGYVDRLAHAADGAYEIHDYKTSSSMPRRRDLDRDRQLSLYELALRARLPPRAVVRQVWHYLAFDRCFSRVRQARDLARVAREVASGIRRVLAERRFPARTGVLCHWCDFNEHCPEGRDYLSGQEPPGLRA